jgi:hypothetical protein
MGFQIELWVGYFRAFQLGNCFGYFSKNWANFFQSFGHPQNERPFYSYSEELHTVVMKVRSTAFWTVFITTALSNPISNHT